MTTTTRHWGRRQDYDKTTTTTFSFKQRITRINIRWWEYEQLAELYFISIWLVQIPSVVQELSSSSNFYGRRCLLLTFEPMTSKISLWNSQPVLRELQKIPRGWATFCRIRLSTVNCVLTAKPSKAFFPSSTSPLCTFPISWRFSLTASSTLSSDFCWLTYLLTYTGWPNKNRTFFKVYNYDIWWRRKAVSISKYSAPY